MATAQGGGLFGPSVDELQQQRQAAIRAEAQAYGQMDPDQRSAAGWYGIGANVGDIAGQATGYVDPQVAKAQKIRQIATQFDTTTPEGMMQAAQALHQSGMSNEASIAVGKAQEMKAATSKQALEAAQAKAALHRAETDASPLAKITPKDYTQESLKLYYQGGMKDPSVLVGVADTESSSADIKLVNAAADARGLIKGTPERKKFETDAYAKLMDKRTHITVAGGGSGGVPLNRPGLSPEREAALNVAISEGRLDPSRLNSRSAALLADQFIRSPTLDMVGATGRAAMQKNAQFVQKNELVRAIPEIMTNMVESGKKMGFSDVRALGNMQAWVAGQTNDPDFTEYMTQRNDALMTIAGVMRAAGMSDMAHRAETEVSSPSMSPKALDAWMRGQMKSLQPRLDIADKYLTPKTPPSAPTAVKGGWGKATKVSP